MRSIPFLSAVLLISSLSAGQPAGPVRLMAEWEPSLGTLIRWPLGIPMALVEELARDDSLYVLVENPSEQAQALSTFQSWGVNTDHCRFITADTWSHWTRDWGPHWMFDGSGEPGIIDPVFDGYPWVPGGPYRDYTDSRGYEEDDLVNQVLAEEFSCALHQFPAYLTGGNFMSDGHGNGFSTLAMLTENEVFWSHPEFLGLSAEWLGLDGYMITVNPEEYGLQHIDCAAKLLNEETILLKQVGPSNPDYARLETINDRLTTEIGVYGRPYEVIRIQCGAYSGYETAAYTNSYILNTKVLVPLFDISTDQAALETYQEAMPGYEIIGVPYTAWYYYDALHCRTREMMDPGMLLIWHMPFRGEVNHTGQFQVDVEVKRYSGADLIPDETGIVWRVDSGSWQTAGLTPVYGDSLSGVIPGQPPGSTVDYYITAADQSGRQEALPRPAPGGFFSFTVVNPSSTDPEAPADPPWFSVSPNPVVSRGVITFPENSGSPVSIQVYSITGRLMDTLSPAGGEPLFWDAAGLPPGCYVLRADLPGRAWSTRVAIIR